ncbi:MAG: outer membrane protein assembly factor BamE domain-containing protein [Pseudobdellovibrionaceae bacterium]
MKSLYKNLSPLMFLLCILCFTLGCQTSMVKQFEQIQSGQSKHDVLELMGSPQSSQRFHGKDRWVYVLYKDGQAVEKEVHFTEGAVSYFGGPWQPEQDKTAQQVDARQSEENRKADEAEKSAKIKNSRAYDEYENEVRKEDKVLYVPQFKPIE